MHHRTTSPKSANSNSNSNNASLVIKNRIGPGLYTMDGQTTLNLSPRISGSSLKETCSIIKNSVEHLATDEKCLRTKKATIRNSAILSSRCEGSLKTCPINFTKNTSVIRSKRSSTSFRTQRLFSTKSTKDQTKKKLFIAPPKKITANVTCILKTRIPPVVIKLKEGTSNLISAPTEGLCKEFTDKVINRRAEEIITEKEEGTYTDASLQEMKTTVSAQVAVGVSYLTRGIEGEKLNYFEIIKSKKNIDLSDNKAQAIFNNAKRSQLLLEVYGVKELPPITKDSTVKQKARSLTFNFIEKLRNAEAIRLVCALDRLKEKLSGNESSELIKKRVYAEKKEDLDAVKLIVAAYGRAIALGFAPKSGGVNPRPSSRLVTFPAQSEIFKKNNLPTALFDLESSADEVCLNTIPEELEEKPWTQDEKTHFEELERQEKEDNLSAQKKLSTRNKTNIFTPDNAKVIINLTSAVTSRISATSIPLKKGTNSNISASAVGLCKEYETNIISRRVKKVAKLRETGTFTHKEREVIKADVISEVRQLVWYVKRDIAGEKSISFKKIRAKKSLDLSDNKAQAIFKNAKRSQLLLDVYQVTELPPITEDSTVKQRARSISFNFIKKLNYAEAHRIVCELDRLKVTLSRNESNELLNKRAHDCKKKVSDTLKLIVVAHRKAIISGFRPRSGNGNGGVRSLPSSRVVTFPAQSKGLKKNLSTSPFDDETFRFLTRNRAAGGIFVDVTVEELLKELNVETKKLQLAELELQKDPSNQSLKKEISTTKEKRAWALLFLQAIVDFRPGTAPKPPVQKVESNVFVLDRRTKDGRQELKLKVIPFMYNGDNRPTSEHVVVKGKKRAAETIESKARKAQKRRERDNSPERKQKRQEQRKLNVLKDPIKLAAKTLREDKKAIALEKKQVSAQKKLENLEKKTARREQQQQKAEAKMVRTLEKETRRAAATPRLKKVSLLVEDSSPEKLLQDKKLKNEARRVFDNQPEQKQKNSERRKAARKVTRESSAYLEAQERAKLKRDQVREEKKQKREETKLAKKAAATAKTLEIKNYKAERKAIKVRAKKEITATKKEAARVVRASKAAKAQKPGFPAAPSRSFSTYARHSTGIRSLNQDNSSFFKKSFHSSHFFRSFSKSADASKKESLPVPGTPEFQKARNAVEVLALTALKVPLKLFEKVKGKNISDVHAARSAYDNLTRDYPDLLPPPWLAPLEARFEEEKRLTQENKGKNRKQAAVAVSPLQTRGQTFELEFLKALESRQELTTLPSKLQEKAVPSIQKLEELTADQELAQESAFMTTEINKTYTALKVTGEIINSRPVRAISKDVLKGSSPARLTYKAYNTLTLYFLGWKEPLWAKQLKVTYLKELERGKQRNAELALLDAQERKKAFALHKQALEERNLALGFQEASTPSKNKGSQSPSKTVLTSQKSEELTADQELAQRALLSPADQKVVTDSKASARVIRAKPARAIIVELSGDRSPARLTNSEYDGVTREVVGWKEPPWALQLKAYCRKELARGKQRKAELAPLNDQERKKAFALHKQALDARNLALGFQKAFTPSKGKGSQPPSKTAFAFQKIAKFTPVQGPKKEYIPLPPEFQAKVVALEKRARRLLSKPLKFVRKNNPKERTPVHKVRSERDIIGRKFPDCEDHDWFASLVARFKEEQQLEKEEMRARKLNPPVPTPRKARQPRKLSRLMTCFLAYKKQKLSFPSRPEPSWVSTLRESGYFKLKSKNNQDTKYLAQSGEEAAEDYLPKVLKKEPTKVYLIRLPYTQKPVPTFVPEPRKFIKFWTKRRKAFHVCNTKINWPKQWKHDDARCEAFRKQQEFPVVAYKDWAHQWFERDPPSLPFSAYDPARTHAKWVNNESGTVFHLSTKEPVYAQEDDSFSKREVQLTTVTGRLVNFFLPNRELPPFLTTARRRQRLRLGQLEKAIFHEPIIDENGERIPQARPAPMPDALVILKPGQGFFSFQTLKSLQDAIADEIKFIKVDYLAKSRLRAAVFSRPFVRRITYDQPKIITLAWSRVRADIFYPLVPRYSALRRLFFKKLLKKTPTTFQILFDEISSEKQLLLSPTVPESAKIQLRHRSRSRATHPFLTGWERSQRSSNSRRRHLSNLITVHKGLKHLDKKKRILFKSVYQMTHKKDLKRAKRSKMKKKCIRDKTRFMHYRLRKRTWRNKRRKRKKNPVAKRLLGDRRWGSRLVRWPVAFPQYRQYNQRYWKARKLSRKRGGIGIAQTYYRSRSGLRSGFEKNYLLSRRNKRESLKKITPHYSVNYALKPRKWHTPRDSGGVPLIPIELSETEKSKRILEKDLRHYEKQRLIRDGRAAKSNKMRSRLLRQAFSKKLQAPKYRDYSWRDLELRTGYPATLGYRVQRRSYRNSFVTNRWWQPTPDATVVFHPFALIPREQQPSSFIKHPRHTLYHTDLEFRQNPFWNALNSELSVTLPERESILSFENAKGDVYKIREFPSSATENKSPAWTEYFTLVSSDRRQENSLSTSFIRNVPKWIEGRREEKAIAKLDPAVWLETATNFNSVRKPEESSITPRQAYKAAIEQSRAKLFRVKPNWWVEQASIRRKSFQRSVKVLGSAKFRRALKRLHSKSKVDHKKSLNRRVRAKILKLPTTWSFVEIQDFLTKYNRRFSPATPKRKVYEYVSQAAFYAVYRKFLKSERLRFVREIRKERTLVLSYGEGLKKRELAQLEGLDVVETDLDPRLKENGTAHQLWVAGRRAKTKDTRTELSSYVHDIESKQVIYQLPFEAPRFPATANREVSYSRSVRVFYSKVLTPRLRTINYTNSRTVRPTKRRDKKVFSAHYARNSVLRSKRRALGKVSLLSYLPKNARVLARAKRQIRPSAALRSVSTVSGTRKTLVKRRFARSPIALVESETKLSELAQRGYHRKGHEVYLAGVLKAARKRRAKLRVVTEKKKVIRQRRTRPEQQFPRWRRLRSQRQLANQKKDKKKARKEAKYCRRSLQSWARNNFKVSRKKREKRPESEYIVDAGGVALTEVTNIDRIDWAKHGLNRQTLGRRDYPSTLTSGRTTRRPKANILQTYLLIEPNKKEKSLLYLTRWFRKKWSKKAKFRRRFKKWGYGKLLAHGKIEQARFDDLYTRSSLLHRSLFNQRKSTALGKSPYLSESVCLNIDLVRSQQDHKAEEAETPEEDWVDLHGTEKEKEERSKKLDAELVESEKEIKEEKKKLEEKMKIIERRKKSGRGALGEGEEAPYFGEAVCSDDSDEELETTFRGDNSTLYAQDWGLRVKRLKIKKSGRSSLQLKNLSPAVRLSEKFAKVELKKNPVKTLNARILEGISSPSRPLALTFYPERVEIIDAAAVTKKDKAFQVATTRALYRVTGEIAASTTQLFSHLISWLRKYRGSGSKRAPSDAESLVSATYWNLRVYLGQDLLGLRLWTKDKSLAQRRDLTTEVYENSDSRPYSALHTQTRRKRRQPYSLTRKQPQLAASLGWLRYWFPRLYKFHLESPDAFEDLTFTITEARRTKPTSAAVKDWETQDIAGNAELAFERLIKSEVHKNSSRYECRLRTARHREPVDRCKDFREQLLSGAIANPRTARPQFFAKRYSTQAAVDRSGSTTELLLTRATQQNRNRAITDDERPPQHLARVHTQRKTRRNRRAFNHGAPRRAESRSGRIDPRATRQKSARNALYWQRRPETLIDIESSLLSASAEVEELTPEEISVAPLQARLRLSTLSAKASTSLDAGEDELRELRALRYIRRESSTLNTHFDSKPYDQLRRILPLNGNHENYNSREEGITVQHSRRHSSSRMDTQLVFNYQPKVHRNAEPRLKYSVIRQIRYARVVRRNAKRKVKFAEINGAILPYKRIDHGIIRPKLFLAAPTSQLLLTAPRTLSTAISSSPVIDTDLLLLAGAPEVKQVAFGCFEISEAFPKSAVITAGEEFLTKLEKRNINILNVKRGEFWAKLTTRHYLKARLVKTWIKDRKRVLLRVKWRYIPEIIFKERRARLRKFEWRESDRYFHRKGWKNAFKFYPREKYRGGWFEAIRRRRTAYSTRHGEYRRYAFPREQKRFKALQYYRKARLSNEPRRLYVKWRRWPRIRTTRYRRYRSFFGFRNTRVAQKHFKKLSKLSAKTTGFSRNSVGTRNRLDVVLNLLGLTKTAFWARVIAPFGLVRVNRKTVFSADYRLKPGDILSFNWGIINRLKAEFSVEKRWSELEEIFPSFKLQNIPGNFSWHHNHNFLIYNRLPFPEDLLKNSRVIQWSFDSFRRDAGIGRR